MEIAHAARDVGKPDDPAKAIGYGYGYGLQTDDFLVLRGEPGGGSR